MDGKTCMEYAACEDANVSSIFLGCNGNRSCQKAGKNGTIRSITNSCFNIQKQFFFSGACFEAAYNGGYIGQITNSCVKFNACQEAASYGVFV